ncbi:MAG: hypothetical protein R6X02_19905 [Enhygromyxa sp.]
MQRSSSILVFALALALACSKEEAAVPDSPTPPERVEPEQPRPPEQVEPEQPDPPEALRAKDGFFMAEGAPEPRACTAAKDCLTNTIPDLDNPCCQNPRSLETYTRTYWSWLHEWRRDNCLDVTCPPPPHPPWPKACALEIDCVEGRCVNAC